MRVFVLPRRVIDAFGSTGVEMDFLPGVLGADQTRVHVARLAAGGMIGRHPAARRQLFVVVDGEGEVVADDGEPWPVRAGHAVLWESGEEHQTWARTPLVAVVVETTGDLDLTGHLEEVALDDGRSEPDVPAR